MAATSALPILPNGYSAVPPGHVAAVVTCLEMRQRPEMRAAGPLPPGFRLEPVARPGLDRYRALFRTVGQDWLWASRLTMSDDALQSILDDPAVQLLVLLQDERDVGIVELDFREPKTCELAFFGVAADLVGKGLGRTLMAEATRRAWSHPIERFWVHTCTFDHPAALGFYRRAGFAPFAVQVEVMPDPRLTGAMPRTGAPHVPVIM